MAACGKPLEERDAALLAVHKAHCDVIRCVFGNPLRPMTVDPPWLAWNGGTVPKMAQAMYNGRTLPWGHQEAAHLAVLADALGEADCDNTDILNHLRDSGPHVRGSWVVDLILGKE